MPRRAAMILLLGGLALATPAAGQTQTPDPPGPYAIDLRGATAAVPQDPGFFPAVPTGTLIPARGFGIDVGGHVYIASFKAARLGVGANLVRVRGSAAPPAPTSTSTPSTTPVLPTTPDVAATVTTLAPQLSFNFGSSAGWSHVSVGYGRAHVKTSRSAFRTGTEAERDHGAVPALNFGGGARWFFKARLAFSFDLRFHMLSAGRAEGTEPATPKKTLVTAAVGISLK
jgi:hypothetical protein